MTAYPEEQRCWHGRLSLVGTLVDESSGSSGTPFNWVRGRRELADIHRNVAGFTSLQMRDEERLFVLNAYSMGAWATGTNTGIAMAKVAMVKNTGPDLDKIVDTIRHFGPGFTYLVTAYPPFLKDPRDRLDAEGFDWDGHRMHGLVGGEAGAPHTRSSASVSRPGRQPPPPASPDHRAPGVVAIRATKHLVW